MFAADRIDSVVIRGDRQFDRVTSINIADDKMLRRAKLAVELKRSRAINHQQQQEKRLERVEVPILEENVNIEKSDKN